MAGRPYALGMADPETQHGLVVVGWRELVDLPEWGITGVRAKIDTGARTSAIHVGEIEELPGDRVRFEVVARERPERVTRWVEAGLARTSVVKPSSGERQERPVVRTTIRIGATEHEAELSLVCRRGMLCRMLVGRTALEGAFVVDPGRTHVADGRKRRKKRRRASGGPTP
jgi:hypothetical protein